MNRAQLVQAIADKTNVTKKTAEDMVQALVDLVTENLKQGGEVVIAGFGAFMARTRKGRAGVNPQKPSEHIQIPSVTVPKFKAGKNLKDALKGKVTSPPQAPAPAASAPAAPTPAPVEPPAPTQSA